MVGVVVESTYNWYWLVDGLKAAGVEVKRAHSVAMKRYDGLKHADDKDDAAFPAHLLQLEILPTGCIHSPQERALRDLARKRIQLVRSRTQHILALEAQIAGLEARLLQQAKLRPEYLLLKAMPGVGEVLATVIMLETSDIERYGGSGTIRS